MNNYTDMKRTNCISHTNEFYVKINNQDSIWTAWVNFMHWIISSGKTSKQRLNFQSRCVKCELLLPWLKDSSFKYTLNTRLVYSVNTNIIYTTNNYTLSIQNINYLHIYTNLCKTNINLSVTSITHIDLIKVFSELKKNFKCRTRWCTAKIYTTFSILKPRLNTNISTTK